MYVMNIFADSENIYSPKIREYFREVISSYQNKNYRSAVVMLYAICLCDLIFKLQELRDLYNDGIAKMILEEVEKIKNNSDSKSSWEKELVEQVHKKTNLIDDDTYADLNYLFQKRNFCAHPALNHDTELIQPNDVEVVAHIRHALDGLLLKPAVFTKNIVEQLSEDLYEKRHYILQDKEAFHKYVDTRYLNRLTNAMYVKTFNSFWILTFKKVDDKCNDARSVNYQLIQYMIECRENIIFNAIKSDLRRYDILDDNKVKKFAIFVFAEHPTIYSLMEDHTKTLIIKHIKDNPKYQFASWFLYSNPKEYMNQLQTAHIDWHNTNDEMFEYLYQYCVNNGIIDLFNQLLLKDLNESISFYMAAHYMYICDDYLGTFSKQDFLVLFDIIKNNSQVYGNHYLEDFCQNVWSEAQRYFSIDDDCIKNNPYLKIKNIANK